MLVKTELGHLMAREATLDGALDTARLLIESRRLAASHSVVSDDIAQHLLPHQTIGSSTARTFHLRDFAAHSASTTDD